MSAAREYSDILEHTTNPQDTDLRVHTRHDELLHVVVDNQIPHTYGAFSHKMRLAAKCAPLLLYFSKISEYFTVAEIRILMVGRV